MKFSHGLVVAGIIGAALLLDGRARELAQQGCPVPPTASPAPSTSLTGAAAMLMEREHEPSDLGEAVDH